MRAICVCRHKDSNLPCNVYAHGAAEAAIWASSISKRIFVTKGDADFPWQYFCAPAGRIHCKLRLIPKTNRRVKIGQGTWTKCTGFFPQLESKLATLMFERLKKSVWSLDPFEIQVSRTTTLILVLIVLCHFFLHVIHSWRSHVKRILFFEVGTENLAASLLVLSKTINYACKYDTSAEAKIKDSEKYKCRPRRSRLVTLETIYQSLSCVTATNRCNSDLKKQALFYDGSSVLLKKVGGGW